MEAIKKVECGDSGSVPTPPTERAEIGEGEGRAEAEGRPLELTVPRGLEQGLLGLVAGQDGLLGEGGGEHGLLRRVLDLWGGLGLLGLLEGRGRDHVLLLRLHVLLLVVLVMRLLLLEEHGLVVGRYLLLVGKGFNLLLLLSKIKQGTSTWRLNRKLGNKRRVMFQPRPLLF